MFEDGIQLDWPARLDPLALLRRWPNDRRVVMLHSGRFNRRWARHTLIAEPAGDYRHAHGRSIWLPGNEASQDRIDPARFTHQPTDDLRLILSADAGLWIGYLGYELGRCFEPQAIHPGPKRAMDDRDWPLIDLACCPGWLMHDAATGAWSAHGQWRDLHQAGAWWRDLPDHPERHASFTADHLASVFTRPAYESAVARVIDYIGAGDIFQANLTQRFTARWEGKPPLSSRAAYAKLSEVSPAWYGAYIETARQGDRPGRVIASTSPELFLEMDAARQVVTRPIKGTRPASAPPEVLRDSAKDAAELHMIVDLLRNDLGRVCEYGSVRVPQGRTIETHPTVHHGVATIVGQLHSRYDLVDLLRATLPGGSVTGAPKIRAMQIIDELEPVARGPYCGAIGYLSRQSACLNVAIRTMLIDSANQRVDFSVGGGIVADSQPADEYDETLAKAQVILHALGLPRPM